MKVFIALSLIIFEKSFIVWSAAECDTCVPGMKGDSGPPGPPGRVGYRGALGKDGFDGFVGIMGERGENGTSTIDFSRNKGDKGDRGINGLPGKPGIPGEKGESGQIGSQGQVLSAADLKTFPNLTQMAGIKGNRGQRGISGKNGEDGIPGPPGKPGSPGKKGAPGLRGYNGMDGRKGMKGEPGVTGPPGMPGLEGRRRRSTEEKFEDSCPGGSQILVQHGQSDEVPDCNGLGETLWTGYSYFATETTPYTADHLGSQKSCVKVEPDSQGERCWLAAQSTRTEQFHQSVSRCAVCNVCSPILVIHSQSQAIPKCPENWVEIWNGFSVIQDGSSSLANTGSCMKKLPQLVGSAPTCQDNTERVWLSSIEEEEEGVSGRKKQINRSRCSVCHASPS